MGARLRLVFRLGRTALVPWTPLASDDKDLVSNIMLIINQVTHSQNAAPTSKSNTDEFLLGSVRGIHF